MVSCATTPNLRPKARSPISRYEKVPVRSQLSASSMNETMLRQAIRMKTAQPVTTVACRRHHGIEKRPAPTMLLMRLIEELRMEADMAYGSSGV